MEEGGSRLQPPSVFMLTLSLIGIGCGDPEQLTLAAIRAINAADLVLIPRKGADKSDLAELRWTICAQVLSGDRPRLVEFDLPQRDASLEDYRSGVDQWHDAVAATWAKEIATHLGKEGRVALLIWGDPSLYDSSLRIARRIDSLTGHDGSTAARERLAVRCRHHRGHA